MYLKTKGRVKKSTSQGVEKSRSRQPYARAKSSRSQGRVCELLDSPRYEKRRNKPGMYMKTKGRVKKSRAECDTKVEPQPGTCLLTPQHPTSRLSTSLLLTPRLLDSATSRLLDCTVDFQPPAGILALGLPRGNDTWPWNSCNLL